MLKSRILLLSLCLVGLLLACSFQATAQVTSPLPNKPRLTVIPHIAFGGSVQGGYQTNMGILNLATGQNGVIVNVISQSGQLVSAGQEQMLPPRAMQTLNYGEGSRWQGGLTVQWLAIGSDGPIGAAAIFDFMAPGTTRDEVVNMVGVLPTTPGTSFVAPFLYERETAQEVILVEGLALANVSGSTNTITLTLFDENGTGVASETLTPLQPYNQTAFTISELTSVSSFLTGRNSFFGSFSITGTQQFAPLIVGNRGSRLFSLPLLPQ